MSAIAALGLMMAAGWLCHRGGYWGIVCIGLAYAAGLLMGLA